MYQKVLELADGKNGGLTYVSTALFIQYGVRKYTTVQAGKVKYGRG